MQLFFLLLIFFLLQGVSAKNPRKVEGELFFLSYKAREKKLAVRLKIQKQVVIE